MTTSEQINEIAAALSKAQGEMGGALKDSANPFFKSKYADLASVWEACRKPLAANGLAVIQSPSADGLRVSMETLLTHTSGQWMRGTVSVNAKEDSPQAIGSAITYLRRYALQSFVGVAPEDDDGEAAHGRNGNARTSEPARAPLPMTPKPPAAPAGYQDWLDDMLAVASNGEEALRKAFLESKIDYRRHATEVDKQTWANLKKRAATEKKATAAVSA